MPAHKHVYKDHPTWPTHKVCSVCGLAVPRHALMDYTPHVSAVEAREKVPDGQYYIFPEGACWQYQEWCGGRRVGSADQAHMGTHRAAGDQYAHCDPDLATEEVPAAVQRSIVGPDADLSRVCVMRVPDEN